MLVVGSLLVTASPAAAASATGKNFTLPAVTRTTYSISGTVRASATGLAVADVAVWASWATSSESGSHEEITDASGAYTISGLLPGSYTLKFDPPRATNLQHGYRTATAPTYFSVSTPAAVKITSASLTGKNIRLPAGYEISGKVTRSNGTTVIANVPVSAGITYDSPSTTTDSAGNYTLMGLSPGSYEVVFGNNQPWLGGAVDYQTGCWYTTPASKFSASCVSHTAVVITTANKTGISPKIPNALKITGYVKTRASTPAPIVGATVSVWGGWEWQGAAVTDATGKYTISGLNPGKYTIEVNGAAGSRVPNGYYVSAAPYYWSKTTASASSKTISTAVTTLATIKPPTGYYIKGKITNTSGTPVADVAVTASGGAGTAAENPSTTTDASGNYAIGPLPPGNTYKIKADPSSSSDPSREAGWYLVSSPNNFTLASSSALSITMTGDKTGINMRLPKGASISGTVTIAGTGGCYGCMVEAYSLTGSLVARTWTGNTTAESGPYSLPSRTTEESGGAYKLQGLPAGSYHVFAWSWRWATDDTHILIPTSGYYKSGAAPNFSATLAGATAITVSP